MRTWLLAGIAAISLGASGAPGEEPPAPPVDLDLEEQIASKLVLIDTLVLDENDRPVPGLTREDFELVVDGKVRQLDTLDVECGETIADEPVGVKSADRRPPVPAEGPRKIVLAMDYMHLDQFQRAEVIEQLRDVVSHTLAPEDEVMIAALPGGLRVEQSFTRDRERLLEVLDRMEHDITLWQPSFYHLTEKPFFAGLGALVHALEHAPGSKAIVLFSNSHANLESPYDLAFAKLAADMAVSRCAVYPVYARGLTATLGPIGVLKPG